METNKYALIIGGSSGIGLATVIKLASTRFNVILIHRDRRKNAQILDQRIDELKKKYSIEIIQFNIDATNSNKINDCITQIKDKIDSHISVVLHSISRGNLKPFISTDQKLSEQDLELTIQAMGLSLQIWVNGLLDNNLIQTGSRIVTLTSEGNNRVWKGYGAVALAKSTLETMSKYLAVELAPLGITVNIIQAGVTETPSLRMIPDSKELIEYSKKRNPNKRLTSPEDVANAIYLLSLPEANWINGSTIHVDGGEHLI